MTASLSILNPQVPILKSGTPDLTKKNSFCPTFVYVMFLWIWKQAAIIARHNINGLIFINKKESVYSAVRAKRLRWSRGTVLVFGTQVHGFKPGRSRRIFQDENILSTPSFGREVKPFVPCRWFTACKIPECYVEVGNFQAKFICHFSPK